jgi:hypothetical protein
MRQELYKLKRPSQGNVMSGAVFCVVMLNINLVKYSGLAF